MRRLILLLGSCALTSACQQNSTWTLPAGPSAATRPLIVPATNGPSIIPGTLMTPGQTVSASIGLGDPNCFTSWDASGVCRQFDLVPAADGDLDVILTWSGPTRGMYDPELFVVAVDGSWVLGEGDWPTRRAASSAKTGSRYRIVVLSYGQALDFQLSAELKP